MVTFHDKSVFVYVNILCLKWEMELMELSGLLQQGAGRTHKTAEWPVDKQGKHYEKTSYCQYTPGSRLNDESSEDFIVNPACTPAYKEQCQ